MLTDPKMIKFESRRDVVDYVTRGFLPPLRKDFNKVMAKLDNPDSEVDVKSKRGKEVVIPDGIINKETRHVMKELMEDVYENRVENRKKLFIVVAAASVLSYLIGRMKK
jgi:hypothetical protein